MCFYSEQNFIYRDEPKLHNFFLNSDLFLDAALDCLSQGVVLNHSNLLKAMNISIYIYICIYKKLSRYRPGGILGVLVV